MAAEASALGSVDVSESLVPDLSTVETDVSTETPEVTEKPEQAVVDPQKADETQRDEQTDGRTIPSQWRELFKSDPKLKGMFFDQRAFRAEFPEGPKAAQALKAEVETFAAEHGAATLTEAAQAIASEREYWQKLDDAYTSGSPDFVKQLAADGPEEFVQMMPLAIDQFAALNKEAYDHVISRVLVNTITEASPLGEIWEALSKSEETKPLADKMAAWFHGLKGMADKQPERKENPEAAKLQEKLNEIEQREFKTFQDDVQKQRATSQATFIHSTLKKEFARVGRNIDQFKEKEPESYWMLVNSCNEAIWNTIKDDKQFLKQYGALLDRRDGASALRLAKGKLESKVGIDAIQKRFDMLSRSFGGTKPATRPNGNGQEKPAGQAAAEVTVPKAPKSSEVDWPRVRATYRSLGYKDEGEMIASGKAFVKGRKEMVNF